MADFVICSVIFSFVAFSFYIMFGYTPPGIFPELDNLVIMMISFFRICFFIVVFGFLFGVIFRTGVKFFNNNNN